MRQSLNNRHVELAKEEIKLALQSRSSSDIAMEIKHLEELERYGTPYFRRLYRQTGRN